MRYSQGGYLPRKEGPYPRPSRDEAVLARPVGQLQPGHENCSAEHIVEKALAQAGSRTVTSCLHDHTEPVYAYDSHGGCVGYHVADHCLCCDRIVRTPEFE